MQINHQIIYLEVAFQDFEHHVFEVLTLLLGRGTSRDLCQSNYQVSMGVQYLCVGLDAALSKDYFIVMAIARTSSLLKFL